MKWSRRGGGLTRVEDRRGQGGGFGMPFPLPSGRGGAGLGGLGIVGLIVGLLFAFVFNGGGFDVRNLPQLPGVQPPGGQADGLPATPEDDLAAFVTAVADDAQALWKRELEAAGHAYEPAGLVIFTSGTVSGCGPASAATGPFYCPADQKIYIDLSFYRELQRRFGAPGDFAQAYVVAHEVAHHVQTLLGVNGEVQRLSQERPEDANELSIRLELQADCLAGVWAHTVFERGDLEAGDLEEGLSAAAAVGDDRIQQKAQGRIDPESWTHGSSEQRVSWFRTGFDSGDSNACDTFAGDV
jgi:predicted metalloprotease